MQNHQEILIIGVGNQYRNDDAAGLILINKLRNILNNSVLIEENYGDGIKLIDQWKNKEIVIIIDAVKSGSKPGTIHKIELKNNSLFSNSSISDSLIHPELIKFSTHLLDFHKVLKLSQSLGLLPNELIIYGIEGKNFNNGIYLSNEVKIAIEKLVLQINNVLINLIKQMEVQNG